MSKLFSTLMTRLTNFLDPRLEKYRPPKKHTPYKPATKEELIKLLKRCNKSVLSDAERDIIAGAMSFPVMPVSSIMHSEKDITYLREIDPLDPLTLDRLYKTGQNCFPVKDSGDQISGLLRLDDLDTLKATEDFVSDHISHDFCYARQDYSLEMLLATFIRANNNFAFVINREGKIVGYVTLANLMEQLSGADNETFADDANLEAVAGRTRK